jgi:cytochrome c oxidase subunit I
MLKFAFGGISGLINASYNVNLVAHNTAWVPGHFHLTV